ncbi:XRE family transcriptional regulator [Roseivivax sediminis]|uniref:Uncharacterized protein n=1 Tax=Roseivivax sediminis TaxID=936889 RepID=A0A1I2CMV6_9RHOB|nr:XRE family transcriptional regulator [Roseivivax sediminis]SFE69564.1 hypothetical protein SAMN04515678_1148 [Roseivivax sediminis]
MARKYPNENSRLARFLDRRLAELSPVKSQRQVAIEAGYVNPNILSQLKAGNGKLALDRVPGLARALDVDPRYLFRLAIEQHGYETLQSAIDEIFGAVVTENEIGWLLAIREASDNSDPRLTRRARAAINAIFGR